MSASVPESRSPIPRALLVLLLLAASWIAFTGIQAMSNVITPLFLVVNLWIVTYPVQRFLQRLHLPGIIGALASAVLILLILAVFMFAIGWAISALVFELSKPEYQTRFGELYTDLSDWLTSIGIDPNQIVKDLQNLSPEKIAGYAGGLLGGVSGTAGWTVAFFTILVGVITDAPGIIQRFIAGARSQPSVLIALVNFSQGVRRYWIVCAIFGFIVALADVAFLHLMGIPLAPVWGVLSFITNFIPVIGFIIGVIPPTLMALFAKDPMTALLVALLYFGINASIQSFIQPKFNGDAVGVTALVSILSLLVWTWALGPLGALLGLPATLLVKALLIDPDPDLRWVNAYIASDPESAYKEPEMKQAATARTARRTLAKRGQRIPNLINRLSGQVPRED